MKPLTEASHCGFEWVELLGNYWKSITRVTLTRNHVLFLWFYVEKVPNADYVSLKQQFTVFFYLAFKSPCCFHYLVSPCCSRDHSNFLVKVISFWVQLFLSVDWPFVRLPLPHRFFLVMAVSRTEKHRATQ